MTNPDARLALILALISAAVLVGTLIWQFEMQRRAGASIATTLRAPRS